MKSKHTLPIVIWTALAGIILAAIASFFQHGSEYIGKDYTETAGFQSEMDLFLESLGSTVLNPLDINKEKKQISVSQAEIEEHRNYYGTLSEQIANIEEQYAGRITEAREEKKEKVKNALVRERDQKIEDIRQNFDDDAHVEAKIRAEKEQRLEEFLENQQYNSGAQPYFPIAYKLKDIKTGEIISSGNMKADAGYQIDFNEDNGYLTAESIQISKYDYTEYYGEAADGDAAIDHAAKYNGMRYITPERVFEGQVIVPQSAFIKGQLGSIVRDFQHTKIALYVLWGLGTIALFAVFFIFRFRKIWVTESAWLLEYNKWRIDVRIALFIFNIIIVTGFLDTIKDRYSWTFSSLRTTDIVSFGFSFIIFILFLWIAVFQLVAIWERTKEENTLEEDLRRSYTKEFFHVFQDMFLNRKIGVQMLVLLIGFFLAGVGFIGVGIQPSLLLIYVPLVIFIGLPFLYIFVKRTAYLNRILIAVKAMAEGRLHQEIKVEGKSPLAEHAANLNNVREGIRISMTEQAKSERLKTELITNVSHDLRTPLTSIITYTDLLKSEELSAEDRAKYVDIIDKKSQRLKTLIEDLFDVSKMASGNLELMKQRVDLTQLLQQALAEQAEAIEKSGLHFRTMLPDKPLIANVDGQRWWRVLENLINNALKYSLEGTRVYIYLQQSGDQAEFILKNVAKYELNEQADELAERFKRADASRHTDGSGLGLAIAQSIVDLHNGNMKIEVDGDLFKVTVKIPL